MNASHNIFPERGAQFAHPHTFEICLYIEKANKDFVEFEQIEEDVSLFLNRFRNKLLNTVPPFDNLPPTIENMGNVFYDELYIILFKNGYHLLRLEIGETPLSVFSVSDSLFVGSLIYNEHHPASLLISNLVNVHIKGAG